MSGDARERFDCPVTWCMGDVEEHGGDGAGPDDWMHQGEAVPLSGGLWVQRWATGTEPAQWQLNAGRQIEIAEGASLEVLATLLESAARELRVAAGHARRSAT